VFYYDDVMVDVTMTSFIDIKYSHVADTMRPARASIVIRFLWEKGFKDSTQVPFTLRCLQHMVTSALVFYKSSNTCLM